MSPPQEPKPRTEREETDASLRAERSKTDDELSKTIRSVEKDADMVVEVARDRAEETLRKARGRADRALQKSSATTTNRQSLELARAAEDGAVAEEQAEADGQLQVERQERQRALAELLRLEREATNDGLLAERARADEAVATRDDFLAIVSHDLRTMLGGIALSAALIAKDAAAAGDAHVSALDHAVRIQRFTARMNRLVSDLLDVVSLEAGELHVTRTRYDAPPLVRDAVEAFLPSFAAKGISLTSRMPDGSIFVDVDHERILQVMANLLSNALKFTPPGGTVVLSVERRSEEVLFSVTDDGVGVPADQAAAIFERFRQVSKDRRGLGLGLYIAKCIVEAHAGKIWVESPEGGGAALLFTLPSAAKA